MALHEMTSEVESPAAASRLAERRSTGAGLVVDTSQSPKKKRPVQQPNKTAASKPHEDCKSYICNPEVRLSYLLFIRSGVARDQEIRRSLCFKQEPHGTLSGFPIASLAPETKVKD
jgi:hypothetical protein